MRSLSNLIKSRYVYVNDENRKIIDSNGKSEELRTINFTRPLDLLPGDGKAEPDMSGEGGEIVFSEGLNAPIIENALSEEEEVQLREQGEQIISDAKDQANQILAQAEEEAKLSSQAVIEEASKQGYEEGMQRAMSEVNQTKKELEQLRQKHNKEYLDQINKLEPMFADVVASLIEKITGVILEEKKDIILYLIHNSIVEADNSKSYMIRVSKEDYDFVSSKKEDLDNLVTQDTLVDIILDKNLSKNQCLIETETRMIDCSLDVQLNNLIQDIKLLSRQKE